MKQPQNHLTIMLLSFLMGSVIWAVSPHVHAQTASAAPTEAFPLPEYQAIYHVSWHGLHSGTSSHLLKKQSNGLYLVETQTHPKVQMLPFHYVESSHFSWQEGKIFPHQYIYNIQEGKKHKKGTVVFDWLANKISNTQLAQPWETEIPEDIHDKLTQTLQLRCALKSSETVFDFNVAERDKFKTYRFSVVGYERLKTKLGFLDTVKVENISRKGYKTTTWMAVDLDFLPVKMQQERNGKVAATGDIHSWQKLG